MRTSRTPARRQESYPYPPSATTRPPDQGTGLGLSLAFDIARDHGGVLEERSAPGSGATFVLRLPTEEGGQTA